MTVQQMIEEVRQLFPDIAETQIMSMLNRALDDFIEHTSMLDRQSDTLLTINGKMYYGLDDLSGVSAADDVLEIHQVDFENTPMDRFLGTISPVVEVPRVPDLLSPANASSHSDSPFVFDWKDSYSADSYQIQLSTTNDFSSSIIFNTTVTSSTHSATIVTDAEYFWRVRATNEQGTSEWSSIWSVTKTSGGVS